MSENLLKQEPYWENYHSMVLNEPTHKIHHHGFIIITLNVFRVTFFLYVISCNVVYSIKWSRANIYCSISIKIQQPVSQQLPSPPLRFQRPLVSIVWLLTRGRDSDLISHTHTHVCGGHVRVRAHVCMNTHTIIDTSHSRFIWHITLHFFYTLDTHEYTCARTRTCAHKPRQRHRCECKLRRTGGRENCDASPNTNDLLGGYRPGWRGWLGTPPITSADKDSCDVYILLILFIRGYSLDIIFH